MMESRSATGHGKTRIAVVSPFLDKKHGTELSISELVERLSRDYGYEVHVYSQSVEDVARVELASERERVATSGAVNAVAQGAVRTSPDAGRIIWHKVWRMPGPHLMNFLWWLAANHVCRWWDRRVGGLKPDLVFSPGPNCLDADIIIVHIVFAEFVRQAQRELRLSATPLRAWPRQIHRRLYYRVCIMLESMVYPRRNVQLAVVAKKALSDLKPYRTLGADPTPVVYAGIDLNRFNPQYRLEWRERARKELGLDDSKAFALLLVGNDLRKKGLDALLTAMGQLPGADLRLFIRGQDSLAPFKEIIERYGLAGRLKFLPARFDVEYYFAAADAYVGPSLEDTFAIPPLEAMACGLPVIVSGQAGVSELITDGVDGLILKEPRDSDTLTRLIGNLVDDPALRQRLGENGARLAAGYTWARNARQFHTIMEDILAARDGACGHPKPVQC
jgi:glycosyltransferase involved in cell wall biosynthesis